MFFSEPTILLALGFFVGTVGTMVGAGGGFLLVPALMILYPSMSSQSITAVSLFVVFCNALSGSMAYAYKKTIDYKSAIIFSLFAAPGSLIGAYATSFVSRGYFENGFGILMVLVSLYLIFGRRKKTATKNISESKYPIRKIVDRQGREHSISYNVSLGSALSVVVGFLSSLFGIGGGIIHVPIMVKILKFPAHVATATSHLILAVSALVGVSIHFFNGTLSTVTSQIIWLAPSVILGAQLGAYLSSRVSEFWIIRILAIGLLSVGVRFLVF